MSHFTREIAEQPGVMRAILADASVEAFAARLRQHQVPLVATLARGSSDNAVTFFTYLVGRSLGLPLASLPPSLVTLYRAPLAVAGALGIGVSQSGESSDVVEGLRALKGAGAFTVAVSNVPGSSLESTADHALAQHAGEELAVAATKTFTSQMMVLARLVAEWSEDDALRAALAAVPEHMERLLADTNAIDRAAMRLTHATAIYVLGRGFSFGPAQEVALKLKETAYLDAEAYSSAEFQHGPIAVIDPGDPLILLATEDASLQSNLEVAGRLREVGADLTVISSAPELLALASTPVALPAGVHEATVAFLLVVAGQLLAAELADSRGIDADAPRHLRKVTLTR